MPYPSTSTYPGAAVYPSTTDSGGGGVTPTIPGITIHLDENPCPRVQVTPQNMNTSTETINLYRTVGGRRMQVRGGVNLYAVGGASVLDLEVPFGVPVTYQAEQFDVNGLSLGFTTPQTFTLPVTDTWVTQPMNPSLAVKAKVFIDSAATQSAPSPGATIWTEGATVGRLIGGQRTGLQQVPIRLRMANLADALELDSMFGGYITDYPSVLCIRTPPNVPLPPTFFAGCLAPKRVQYGDSALLTYELTADEVAPPSPGLIIPTLRREDIDAAYPTRAARAAAYATRLERDTDYTLAGLAG